jgi:DNA-binding NtrC family response regulator
MIEAANEVELTERRTVLPSGYRLRAEVEGEIRTFQVRKGETSIGSRDDNDIYLPCRGISRRHAVLKHDNTELLIEDLGSTNGTFVNGGRTTVSPLRAGDRIDVGEVRLRLEPVEASDTEMAIVLDGARHGKNVLANRPETPRTAERRRSDELPRWVELANRLGADLLSNAEPDVTALLHEFAGELGTAGVCLVEWEGRGEPAVLSGAGRYAIPSALEAAGASFARIADAGKDGSLITSFHAGDEDPVAIAVAAGPTLKTRGLVAWGNFPHQSACLPLLELVLRLILHSQPEHIALDLEAEVSPPPLLLLPADHVLGKSEAMRSVYRQMQQLVKGDIPVLITGETGVGKEHIARSLHQSSSRRDGPFQIVHCAAIPADLLEAELFGIERGVATGVTERLGKFQLAQGGVVLLDEISDMPLGLQAKMLRVLQAMEVHPVGARAPVRVDVRVLAATNANLEILVSEGRFRRDLYYRIAGYTLRVPPLRQRRADIPALVELFLRRAAREVGKSVRGISVRALRSLVGAPWPGNVRQLEHEVRRIVYLSTPGEPIDSSQLSPEVLAPAPCFEDERLGPESDLSLDTRVAHLERKLITLALALARARGNRSKAARMLGLSRNGLAMKISRLGFGEEFRLT